MTGWDTLTTLKIKKRKEKKSTGSENLLIIYVKCLDPRVWDEMLITQSVNILKFSRLLRLLRHKRNVIESKPKNIRITSNHTGQLGTCFISKDIILTEQKTKQNGMLKY